MLVEAQSLTDTMCSIPVSVLAGCPLLPAASHRHALLIPSSMQAIDRVQLPARQRYPKCALPPMSCTQGLHAESGLGRQPQQHAKWACKRALNFTLTPTCKPHI